MVSADSVIISTGASAKWLGLESETRLRLNGGGVSACAVCDGFFYRGQEVAVVGAGDSACEEASYLAKLCTKVHMLVRRDQMRASKAMQHRVMGMDNIEIHWNTETVDILGAEQVEGAKVRNNQTGEETVLPVTGFFLAIGHKPNTDIFAGQIDLDEEGYIIAAKPGSAYTNVEGVFWRETPATRRTARPSRPPVRAAWPPLTPSAGSPQRASIEPPLHRLLSGHRCPAVGLR